MVEPSVRMLRTYSPSVMQQNSSSPLCSGLFLRIWAVGHPRPKHHGYFSTLNKINDDDDVSWPFLKAYLNTLVNDRAFTFRPVKTHCHVNAKPVLSLTLCENSCAATAQFITYNALHCTVYGSKDYFQKLSSML